MKTDSISILSLLLLITLIVAYKYCGQTPITQNENSIDEILKIENQVICVQTLEKYIYEKLHDKTDLASLNQKQRNFILNENILREVNNGGFKQFYLNSSGEFAHETISSLRAIGAIKTSKIVEEANRLFPNQIVPKDRSKRINTITNLDEQVLTKFSLLEKKFYKSDPLEIDSIAALQIKYVKENKDSFI